jgi:predicted transcriptional regulator
MSKAVLISIRPEWCEKIINGRKNIEVRKTRPKMDTPFKCYIYRSVQGGVIGEFVCDDNEMLLEDILDNAGVEVRDA